MCRFYVDLDALFKQKGMQRQYGEWVGNANMFHFGNINANANMYLAIANANMFSLEKVDINASMYFVIAGANMFSLENVNVNTRTIHALV